MANKKTLVGRVFGKLKVVAFCGSLPGRNRDYTYRVRCECGETIIARHSALKKGRRTSCGCSQVPNIVGAKAKTDNYEFVPASSRPEYDVWRSMKQRCGEGGHKDYAGRGISVCEQWVHSFETFFAHMGPRPSPQHSLDRIDNDGNYEPGNCRWATRVQQANNTRKTAPKKYVVMGVSYSLSELAVVSGVSATMIRDRIRKGWTVERACSQPVTSNPINGNGPRPKLSDVDVLFQRSGTLRAFKKFYR